MGFEKKFGLGILGAAALAGCGPQKTPDNIGLDTPEASAVMTEASDGNIDITLPEEGGAEVAIVPEATPQYTPEQEKQILSGETGEVDDMTTEEIAKLKPPQ